MPLQFEYGDITALKVGAIVNAPNEKLTSCLKGQLLFAMNQPQPTR